MSLCNYFKSGTKAIYAFKLCHSLKDKFPGNIIQNELDCVQKQFDRKSGGKEKKRSLYEEKDKEDIAKYAAQFGTTAAVRKFKQRFSNLTESTVRTCVKDNLKEKKGSEE